MDYKSEMAILYFDSSSDDEVEYILSKPVKVPNMLLDADNDSDIEEVTEVTLCALKLTSRDERTKITYYVENVVPLYSDGDFIMHFRVQRSLAYDLIQHFESTNLFKNLMKSYGKQPLSSTAHILTFLWFVGHQDGYREVADRFGITLSTLFQVITRVCEFILSFSSQVIKLPTEEQKAESAAHFLYTKKFPNVIGAVDGTHINMNKPKYDPDSYFTRKKNFAVHVQGIVNHKKKFIDVFAGYPGSVHDARVFKECDLFPNLPELCSDNYIILGDSAYPLMKEVVVPYRDNGHLSRKQRHFNYSLSSCRIVIEHAFGQLKQRFRQLYFIQLRNYHRIVKIIYVCCILHNLASEDDLKHLEPPLNTPDQTNMPSNSSHCDVEVIYDNAVINAYRNQLCDTVWNLR